MMPASPQRDTSPEPEPDAEAAGASGDELVLLVEPLDSSGSTQRRGVELRPLLNIASLALLLALLLAGAATVLRLRSSGATRSVITSDIQIVLSSSGANGWNPGGTAGAQDIAFAPSAPALAYDCGAPTLSLTTFTPVPIAVSASRDGGRTWRALPSPGTGVTCSITVNPTAPQDVVLMVSPSSTFASKPIVLYRSFDGGRTWTRWTLPPRLGAQFGDAQYATWAWAGSSLFLTPYYPGTIGYGDLAASIAGRPFVWVQQNGLFRSAPDDASINQLLGTPSALYAVLFSQSTCTQSCTRVLTSSDGGSSWSVYAPTFQGHPIALLFQNDDGRTLFGGYFDDPAQAAHEYVYSSDGGVTWRQLPPLPPRSIASDMFATPDGTDYATLDTNPEAPTGSIQPGVYRLSPHASAWTFVAPPVDDGSGPVVVSWNAAGHPLLLWSNIHTSIADGIQPGLQHHPA